LENIDEKNQPKAEEAEVLHAVVEHQIHEDILPTTQQIYGEIEEQECNPSEEANQQQEEKQNLEREKSGDRESVVENISCKESMNEKKVVSEQTCQQYHPNPLYRSKYLQENEETEQKHFDYKDNDERQDEAYAMLKESKDLISQFQSRLSNNS
jgi:hypothetical protein